MANKQHLEVLSQGTEAWNHWRERYPEVIPDLRASELTEVNLSGMNLRGANLSEIEGNRTFFSWY